MRLLSCLFALFIGVSAALTSFGAKAEPITDPENTLIMMLKTGRVVIELRPDLAPHTVFRVKQLARQGFYDGTPWHRVIDGFMAQGGGQADEQRDQTGQKTHRHHSSASAATCMRTMASGSFTVPLAKELPFLMLST